MVETIQVQNKKSSTRYRIQILHLGHTLYPILILHIWRLRSGYRKLN